MAELPDGTVTFLFTDIEGSTRLWEQNPDAMRDALARHDALLTLGIEQHGGRVIKSRGEGDSLFAVFAHAPDALAAARALQESLLTEPWPPQTPIRVRMALHTDTADLREGDYYGPGVIRCARLRAVGHGGQVLVSQATAMRVAATLPDGTRLRSLGVHRLRDISSREPIFQLIAPGLRTDFPPLNTLEVAFRRGLLRAMAIATTFVIFVGALALFALNQARLARRATASEALQRQQVEERLYAADMFVAHRQWEVGNVRSALELLEAHRPTGGREDRRGFEWRYLWRLCQQGDERFTLRGHTDWVSVGFSPEGKTLMSLSGDGTVKAWDLSTRREVSSLKWPKDAAALSWSSRSGLLATVSQDDSASLIDLTSGRERATLNLHGTPIVNIALSPSGQMLAVSSGDRAVRLWDVRRRRVAATLTHRENTELLSFSPDGRYLAVSATAETNAFTVWDTATWREVAFLKGEPPGPSCMEFSADGNTLASGDYGGTVCLWDLPTKRQVVVFRAQRGRVLDLAFSPDGHTLAAGGDAPTIRLWDVATRQERAILRGHEGGVFSVAFSPDGKNLASGSLDHSVKLWGLTTKPEVEALRTHTKGISGIAFSPNGKLLASGSWDGTAKVRSLSTRRVIATFPRAAGLRIPVFSPDGKLLAVGNTADQGEIVLWDVKTRRVKATWGGDRDGIIGLAFSPDGQMLATGGSEGTVKLRHVASGRVVALPGHKARVRSVAFSPNGKTLASASDDGTARLWDVVTRREIGRLTRHTDGVFAVAFSPDGITMATASWDHTVKLWDAATQRELATLPGSVAASGVAFSPDGKTLATGHLGESVKLWNLATRQEVASFEGPRGYAPVVFSPDGQWLASGSGVDDRSVLLWRASSFAEADARLDPPRGAPDR